MQEMHASLNPVKRQEESPVFQFRIEACHVLPIGERPTDLAMERLETILPFFTPLPPLFCTLLLIFRISNGFSQSCRLGNTVRPNRTVRKNPRLHVIIETDTVFRVGEERILPTAEPHIRNLKQTLRKHRNPEFLNPRFQKPMIHIFIEKLIK